MLARRVFLTTSLAVLTTAATAQVFPASLTGTYTAQGRNPDGSAYVGVVRIEDDGTSLRFKWNIGATSYTGIGSRDGRVVTVDWSADTPVVYVIMEDGNLHGTWAGGTALELLVREN